MRILFISPSYPPNSGSHTQRVIPMCQGLIDAGHEVIVISQDIPSVHPKFDASLQASIHGVKQVFKAPMGALHKKALLDLEITSKDEKVKHRRIKNRIYKFANAIKSSLLLPDTMIDWYFSVIKFEKKNKIIKRISPDIIFSCSMPNTVHLISYYFSKKYRIPVYMDIADPWAFLGNYKKHPFKFIVQYLLEKKCINNAIGTSYSAPGCRKLYEEKYHLSHDKVIDVLTGFEKRLFVKASEYKQSKKNSKLVFTYGGALQEGVRDPRPFFIASRKFEDAISVTLRTDTPEIVKSWLEDAGGAKCIKILDYINFDEYFMEMMSSDIILFFGNSNDIQLPGKIFNCIATGKEILYLKSNNIINDTVEQILHGYKLGRIIENNPNEIEKEIYSLLRNDKKLIGNNYDGIVQYSAESQFGKLARHLEYCYKNSKGLR